MKKTRWRKNPIEENANAFKEKNSGADSVSPVVASSRLPVESLSTQSSARETKKKRVEVEEKREKESL